MKKLIMYVNDWLDRIVGLRRCEFALNFNRRPAPTERAQLTSLRRKESEVIREESRFFVMRACYAGRRGYFDEIKGFIRLMAKG